MSDAPTDRIFLLLHEIFTCGLFGSRGLFVYIVDKVF